MDNLEKYIRENRKDLDQYEPSEKVWKGIKSGLPAKKRIVPVWLSIAAMIIVIMGTAFILYTSYLKNNLVNTQSYKEGAYLKETEIYYNTLVNTLYQEAKPLLTSQPDIEREINIDLTRLDSICSEIRKDLKDNVANQEVIEALIQNYRIKLQLLEDMLSQLKQYDNNSENKKSHEL